MPYIRMVDACLIAGLRVLMMLLADKSTSRYPGASVTNSNLQETEHL